jgi:thiol:disulfide interchange protein
MIVKFVFRMVLWIFLALAATACASTNVSQTTSNTAERAYTPSDISLVGNTGRPQFLDSYADW